MTVSIYNQTPYDMTFVFSDGTTHTVGHGEKDKHVDKLDILENIKLNNGTYTKSSGSFADGDAYTGTFASDSNVITFTDTTNPQSPPVVFTESTARRK